MTYLALARKWRPRRFADVRGQRHVVQALAHALDRDRLHPAILLTGTRGVGKTTLGRIIAKGLNCESGVSADPCGVCSACREVDEGRFVDLLEIDAASRTKVDDTRQLLDNVQYAPVRGRYKVYLIDEVHMLSNSSFNALLKTLEEPPPHVKFILATTDPQKLPITVLSRCLQFALKRLPVALIRENLAEVLEKEGVPFEPGVVAAIAHAADGSMRDGLSLLDQAIAFAGGGALQTESVEEMVGAVGRRAVLELLQALAASDGAALLATIARLDAQAPDYAALLNELATRLQRLAVLQVLPQARDDEDEAALLELATALPPEDVQVYYQIAILGRRDLPWAPDPRIGFEMTLLRMLAFQPEQDPSPAGGTQTRAAAGATRAAAVPGGPSGTAPRSSAAAQQQSRPASAGELPASASASAATATATAAPTVTAPTPAATPPPPPTPLSAAPLADGARPAARAETRAVALARPERSEAVEPAPAAAPNEESAAAAAWALRIDGLNVDALTRQFLRHCAFLGEEAGVARLQLEYGVRHLLSDDRRSIVERALAARIGVEIAAEQAVIDSPVQLDRWRAAARQQVALQAFDRDPVVQEFRRLFGASVRSGSVQPSE